MVVRYEPKDAALSEHGGLVIKRTIFEVKCQARSDTITADDLDEITMGKYLSLLGGQGQKAVKGALRMARAYRLAGGLQSQKLHDANQRSERSPASKFFSGTEQRWRKHFACR